MGTKIGWVISLSLLVGSIFSQTTLDTRKHLAGSTATIATGFQKNNPDMNIYVHGFVYFHPQPKVSLDGEGYWYLGAQNQETLMAENSTLLFGPSFHFAKDGPVDPYVGIMSAVSLVSAIDRTSSQPVVGKYSVVPLIAFNVGFKYHFIKWFNIFANAKYMMGTLTENYPTALSLNEFRFSFGLGFNLFSANNHYGFKKPD